MVTLTVFPVQGEECLKIASGSMEGVIKRFLPGIAKAMKLAGFCYTHQQMPLKRIQRDMIRGDLDAEFVRVDAYLKRMKDYVIPVPTPLISASGVIVTLKSSGFQPSGFADIEGKLIGYVAGINWHIALARKVRHIKKGGSYANLVRLMKARRIDGFIIDDVTFRSLITRGFIKEGEVHKSYPVVDLTAYFVVHKNKKHLIDDIDRAIRKVKQEGGFKVR